MEEAFRREKEEADRLLREQKLEYESKIVELQKQVIETSMSQSMLSSILSSTGLVDTSTFKPSSFPQDFLENDNDTLSCMFLSLDLPTVFFWSFLSLKIDILDCSWSEQDYQLAWWAWKKWRYHQMTSLRVSEILHFSDDGLNSDLGLFQSYSTDLVDQGIISTYLIVMSHHYRSFVLIVVVVIHL